VAVIPDLPARFRVERCGIKHDNGTLPRLYGFDGGTVDIQGHNPALADQRLVAVKSSGISLIIQAFGTLETTRCPRLLALTLHRAVESRLVDSEPTFTANVGSQINREAVGVIQGE